jgi:hypothetical protein
MIERGHTGTVAARSAYSTSVVVTCSCGNWTSPRYESMSDALDAFETHRYRMEISPRDPRIAGYVDGIGRGLVDDDELRYLDEDIESPTSWEVEPS